MQSAHLFRQVRAQGRQLERAIFLQRELSRTAFDAPGMGPLAERLTDLVNRPVMVLDPALRNFSILELLASVLASMLSWANYGNKIGYYCFPWIKW